MDWRGIGEWKGIEHAKTLTPNHQCWEAVMKWVHEDGMTVNYMLKIRDQIYSLSNAISNVKKSMESFMAQLKWGWHFQNIVQFFFNFLNSPEGQVLKQRQGVNVRTYPTHWRQALCITCQIPFKSDERMFNPQTNWLNHNINDISQIVREHDDRSTIYYGNDGIMTFVAAYIAVTQVDDSKMGIRHTKHWLNKEFVHQIVYTLRDFLLKPIWSAKQLKANPPIEIPAKHCECLIRMAAQISNNFDDRCWEVTIRQGCSLNAARVNTSIMITCWKDWQDAALLLTDLINELLLRDPLLGAIALTVQKQVYLQILLYGAFLGVGSGSASETKHRLLPQLYKYLFDGQPRLDEANGQASGQTRGHTSSQANGSSTASHKKKS